MKTNGMAPRYYDATHCAVQGISVTASYTESRSFIETSGSPECRVNQIHQIDMSVSRSGVVPRIEMTRAMLDGLFVTDGTIGFGAGYEELDGIIIPKTNPTPVGNEWTIGGTDDVEITWDHRFERATGTDETCDPLPEDYTETFNQPGVCTAQLFTDIVDGKLYAWFEVTINIGSLSGSLLTTDPVRMDAGRFMTWGGGVNFGGSKTFSDSGPTEGGTFTISSNATVAVF